jgi:predicted SnoaL-like aldol condensation-catalyzing enzyme
MSADRESNKAIVLNFYEKALNERNADAALEYVGAYYKQHNPLMEDDREGLRKYLAWIQDDFPKSHSKVLQIFADGEFVVLHVHRVRAPGMRGDAIVDIFRVEQGKIVEHWDVIQPVPDAASNTNTMF